MAVLPVLRYHPNDNAYRDNRGADDCQPLRARVLPVADNPTTHRFADKRGLLRPRRRGEQCREQQSADGAFHR
ncbi:MAG: hypothetical protein DMG29_19125 [Acidobacteria bacterium]|nr:MAG: hypothetical protein DMG29_19125 [Acidobacteriota bacterium]